MVLRPWARSSRACAGAPGAAADRLRGDVYASLMLSPTIAEAARRFGDRTAYIAPTGWELSYADIDRISDEVALGLARRGVREGDVVALVLPPGLEYLLCYAAAAKLGAVTAGVNSR